MSERDPLGFAAVLAAMTVAVYITRAGGYWLIGRITIGPRLRNILDALPGAIIAATIAPILVHWRRQRAWRGGRGAHCDDRAAQRFCRRRRGCRGGGADAGSRFLACRCKTASTRSANCSPTPARGTLMGNRGGGCMTSGAS